MDEIWTLVLHVHSRMAVPAQHIRVPTLVDLLQQRAQEHPVRRAYTLLVDGEIEETSITYRELDARARTIAAHLHSMILPGERALLLYSSG